MMNYYVEITLIPSVDIGVSFIMEKVFSQIHLGLVGMQNQSLTNQDSIGVSFPEYDFEDHNLGSKIRLFANKQPTLETFMVVLNAHMCNTNLLDYIHVTGIRGVPEKILSYAHFMRIQTKSSNVRLARRKAKRSGIELEQALEILNKYEEKTTDAPFINMTSGSSKQRFKLFIEKREAYQDAYEGFSFYGLSSKSTVPLF